MPVSKSPIKILLFSYLAVVVVLIGLIGWKLYDNSQKWQQHRQQQVLGASQAAQIEAWQNLAQQQLLLISTQNPDKSVYLTLADVLQESQPTTDPAKLELILQEKFPELYSPAAVPEVYITGDNNIIGCKEGVWGLAPNTSKIIAQIESSSTNIDIAAEGTGLSQVLLATSNSCAKFNTFKNNTNNQLSSVSSTFENLFKVIYKIDGNFGYEIKDPAAFKETLAKLQKDTTELDTSTLIKAKNMYLSTGTSQAGKKVNVDLTFNSIVNRFSQGDVPAQIDYIFDTSFKVDSWDGLPVKYFPVKVSNGVSKLPQNRKEVFPVIRLGLDNIKGAIIAPRSQFSLLKELDAKIYGLKTSDAPRAIVGGGDYGYSPGICAVSTVVFRSALEGGFPIKERHPHVKAIQNYTRTPYDGYIVDAALFMEIGTVQDFKFDNNTDKNMLILTGYTTDQEGYFRYWVDIWAEDGYEKPTVVLKDFGNDKGTKSQRGFTEWFTRSVNGQDQQFKTRYYTSDF